MLREAENWAEEFNVTFSTDPDPKKCKSKLIFMCGNNKRLPKPADISLCGRALPWVASGGGAGSGGSGSCGGGGCGDLREVDCDTVTAFCGEEDLARAAAGGGGAGCGGSTCGGAGGLVYSRVTEGVAFVGKAGVDAVVTFWMFSLGCFP